jgi:membrane protein DedA with SNARE-associated domain
MVIEEYITPWLRDYRQYALLAVPAIAFLEAFVGIGFFIPGVILLSVCTILYTEQIATLQQMLPLAFAGAVLSDHSGYYFGRLTGKRFHQTQFAQKRIILIEKAEANIVKYGAFAIFFGRFMTPIRSIVPLLTGASGMPRLRYSVYDVVSCLVWTFLLAVLIVGLDTLLG